MNPTSRRLLEEHRVELEGGLQMTESAIDWDRRRLMEKEVYRLDLRSQIDELNQDLEAIPC